MTKSEGCVRDALIYCAFLLVEKNAHVGGSFALTRDDILEAVEEALRGFQAITNERGRE